MKKSTKNSLSAALGSTFIAAMSASPIANADTNPFGMQDLENGYMQVAEAKCGEGMKKTKEAKCGEAKCGEGMKKTKEAKCGEGVKKATEAKCGEGKCGEGMMKTKEAKCGEDMKKAKEAKCGGM